jgi:hypothetical protein
MTKLRIIACRLGEAPKVEEMEPGLKPMQDFVGGYIEAVRLTGQYGGAGVDLYCDEEFLLKSYAPNRLIRNDLAIHGDFFISAHDEEGETVGLTEAECAEWLAKAQAWPVAIIF